MSTYEEEHNLNRAQEGERQRNDGPERPNQRRHQTLQQVLDNFLASTASNNNVTLPSTISGLPFANDNVMNPQMISMLQSIIESSSSVGVFGGEAEATKGVDDAFLDALERVPAKTLNEDDACPICTNEYSSDSHPLVVQLPCNSKHRFDLECIGPWLKTNITCPLCRVDVTKKKEMEILVDSEEEEEDWEIYG